MPRLLLFTLMLSLLPWQGFAAAWLQPKGEALVITNVEPYLSCNYWNLQGDLQSGPCFHQFTVNPYIEYGLVSKLTLVLNAAFLSYSQAGATSPFGPGYATVSGRLSLWESNWTTLSTQIGYNAPFKPQNFAGNAISSQYALANEERFLDFRLLFGTGGPWDATGDNTWYLDMEGAYRPYFNGAATEVHVDFMMGWKTWGQRLVFELQQLNTLSMHNPSSPIQPNYNLSSIMPDIIYWFKPTVAAVQVGVKQDFYGVNSGRGTMPFIALFWRFK